MKPAEVLSALVMVLLALLMSVLSSCEAERRGCRVETAVGCAP